MGRLASQTAAHKLAQILGLLVIPIIVLLSISFFSSKSDIDALNREIDGAKLAVLFIANPNLSNLKTAIGGLERAIALPPVKGFAAKVGPDIAGHAAYLNDVGRYSGLALDGELESHALAEAGLVHIPTLLSKLDGLTRTLDGLVRSPVAARQDPTLFLLSAADASATFRRIEDTLELTRIGQGKLMLASVQSLREGIGSIEKLASELTSPMLSILDKKEQLIKLAAKGRQLIDEAPANLQVPVLKALTSRLAARRNAAWRNLILLTFTGAASALAGIGLAILMMRSTLVRLDEVELSRAEAQEARKEAENMALRLSTINNDISNLNQELAVKVKALNDAQDELIKKGRLEQLGQLTATIAHEIRNPLGAIRTSAFLLERKTAKFGEDLAGHLQRINNGVNRCDTIISQLLDFSRTKEINSSLIQLDDWLAKVVREEATRLPENIYIECALGLEERKVAFDPSRLQRAIINILNNASEALAHQEQKDRLHGQHATIWVTTLLTGDFATIRVSDNGPGIAAESMQKIREPLFTTKSFGTGLGIPAVEQIAVQHGGRLDITSEAGEGATFSISLPINNSQEIYNAA